MVALSVPDFIILLVLVSFAAYGFALGLVHVVGGLVGIVLGAWLGNLFYLQLGQTIAPYLLGHEKASSAIAFFVIFLLVNRLTAIAFSLLNRIINLLSFIPLLKSLNRIAGGLFGLLEGALLLGVAIRFSQQFWAPLWAQGWIAQSQFAGFLVALVGLFEAILPAVLDSARPPQPYGTPQVV